MLLIRQVEPVDGEMNLWRVQYLLDDLWVRDVIITAKSRSDARRKMLKLEEVWNWNGTQLMGEEPDPVPTEVAALTRWG